MIKIKKFRTRLSIPIFLSIVFFGLIATYIGALYVYNNLIDNQKKDLEVHLKITARQVGSTLQRIVNINNAISSEGDVISYFQSSHFVRQNINKDITEKINNYFTNFDIKSLSLIDLNGDEIFSTDSQTSNQNHSDKNYFKSALADKYCPESLIDQDDNKLYYYFAVPVKENSSIIGILLTKINPEYLHSYLKLENLEAGSRTIFADKNGVALYSSDDKDNYSYLGDVKLTESEKLLVDNQYNQQVKQHLTYDVLQDYIQSRSKDVKIFDYSSKLDDRSSEILAITNVGDCLFYVIYEINKDTFVFGAIRVALVLAGCIVTCAVLALVIILVLLDRSVKPLKTLEEAARKIGSGNFNVGIDIKTDDEFKRLAEVIVKMEADLKDIYANLEQKVKEKTADLAKFQMAVSSTSEHIVITDNNGVIIFANKAVSKTTGFSNKEVIGKKAGSKDLWGGQMPPDFYKKLWDTVCKHKKPFVGVINNKKKNGVPYVAAAIISPILDENNEVIYIVATERDITKEAEVDKAKTEFVSLASHQLRTPLSAINWYTEMILNGDAGKITSDQRKYLDEIYKGNKRMVDLVNSLLNVSRLDLGTFEIDPKPTVIHEVCADVFEEMEHTIEEKKQKLIINCPGDALKISVDPKLMRIIIQNLVSNAVKYTPEGGTITVGLKYNKKDEKNTYVITVSDSGYGIPKNQQSNIFEKLFRADNVRAMDAEGTGLGLYIIKAILDEAGGKISFKSTENKGTTFTVVLPKDGMKQKTGTKKIS